MINQAQSPYLQYSLKLAAKLREDSGTMVTNETRILKLADRISNLTSLPFSGDIQFISGYVPETEEYILPYAGQVSEAMLDEIQNRIEANIKSFQQ